jgi:hypothetical protein
MVGEPLIREARLAHANGIHRVNSMTIPTEPIGSIPRPLQSIEAITKAGDNADPTLDPLYEEAIRDTIECFEATGSPVISDGEQGKYHNPIDQLGTTDDCGFSPFSDDTSTTRETAFEKIRARVLVTALTAEIIGDR